MNSFKTLSQKRLDDEISRLMERLGSIDPNDSEYEVIASNVKLLCESREKKNPLQISADTIVNATVSLVGILLILNFERAGVITSKAFGLVFRK